MIHWLVQRSGALTISTAHLSLRSHFQKEGAQEEPAEAAVRGRIARPRPWPSNPRMRPASPTSRPLASPPSIMSLCAVEFAAVVLPNAVALCWSWIQFFNETKLYLRYLMYSYINKPAQYHERSLAFRYCKNFLIGSF